MPNLESRFIGIVDIPEPQQVNAKFVYNFFTKDERTNRSGMRKFHGTKNSEKEQMIADRTFEAKLPRYIEVNFAEVNIVQHHSRHMSDPQLDQYINNEETLTSSKDAVLRYTDENLRSRLENRAKLLADTLAITGTTSSKAAAIKEINSDIDISLLQQALSPIGKSGITYVNAKVNNKQDTILQASSLTLASLLDRRSLTQAISGNSRKNKLFNIRNEKIAEEDSQTFLARVGSDDEQDSFEPTFKVIASRSVSASHDIDIRLVGYILKRKEFDTTGKLLGEKQFVLDGGSSTSFIDTTVVYGSVYKYEVATAVIIYKTVPSGGNRFQFQRITALLTSRGAPSNTVSTIETIPPKEPSAILYRLDPDSGNLNISWQAPAGKQRDTKYYQIFRRKTIYEPFTLIAQLDFDDSTKVELLREFISESSNISLGSSSTFYADHTFRQGSYIYTVVAVDAHGLTSGYGTQTRVAYARSRNRLALKTISRSGAPKQYPNFYIDPDLDDNIFVDSLTQDALMASQKKKIKIFFDPDAVSYSSSSGDTGTIIATQGSQGVYKVHLMNVDRQKSAVLELAINDLGES